MPNWNYNSVEIHAPKEAVEWPVSYPTQGRHLPSSTCISSSRRRSPQTIRPATRPGTTTGSSIIPGQNGHPRFTSVISDVDRRSPFGYDTARTPNNGTLQRLHEKTGWTIRNDYLEEGMQFAVASSARTESARRGERIHDHLRNLRAGKPEEEYDEEQTVSSAMAAAAKLCFIRASPTCEVCRQRKLSLTSPSPTPGSALTATGQAS